MSNNNNSDIDIDSVIEHLRSEDVATSISSASNDAQVHKAVKKAVAKFGIEPHDTYTSNCVKTFILTGDVELLRGCLARHFKPIETLLMRLHKLSDKLYREEYRVFHKSDMNDRDLFGAKQSLVPTLRYVDGGSAAAQFKATKTAVFTGESGSGKTVGLMSLGGFGLRRNQYVFIVYVSALSQHSTLDGQKEPTDANTKLERNNRVLRALVECIQLLLQGLAEESELDGMNVLEGIQKLAADTATGKESSHPALRVVVAVDEIGGCPYAYRALCSEGFVPTLKGALFDKEAAGYMDVELVLGIAGTGLSEATTAVGSNVDSYRVYTCGNCVGRKVFRSLLRHCHLKGYAPLLEEHPTVGKLIGKNKYFDKSFNCTTDHEDRGFVATVCRRSDDSRRPSSNIRCVEASV
eukprot:PhM_4_TR18101/c1_g2_i3/m.97548